MWQADDYLDLDRLNHKENDSSGKGALGTVYRVDAPLEDDTVPLAVGAVGPSSRMGPSQSFSPFLSLRP